VAFSSAKLALFYDWLGYNPESDNIMNIGQSGLVPRRAWVLGYPGLLAAFPISYTLNYNSIP